jgi:hypothetical protein
MSTLCSEKQLLVEIHDAPSIHGPSPEQHRVFRAGWMMAGVYLSFRAYPQISRSRDEGDSSSSDRLAPFEVKCLCAGHDTLDLLAAGISGTERSEDRFETSLGRRRTESTNRCLQSSKSVAAAFPTLKTGSESRPAVLSMLVALMGVSVLASDQWRGDGRR